MNVLEAIRTRRSVRSYANRPIPEQVMQHMRDALRCAPSACNIQPWHFVFVTDENLRRQLGGAANGQFWIAEAPVISSAVGCQKRRIRVWVVAGTVSTSMWRSRWIT